MKPVYQTINCVPPNGVGNCLQACVASIFELPLDDVPHFMLDAETNGGNAEWFASLALWCRIRGFEPVLIGARDCEEGGPGASTFSGRGYFIASGKSPRYDGLHSVVYHNWQCVHDPAGQLDQYPNGFVGDPVDFIVFAPLNPAELLLSRDKRFKNVESMLESTRGVKHPVADVLPCPCCRAAMEIQYVCEHCGHREVPNE